MKDDVISRQAAINAIENTDVEITAEEWDELTNAIVSLPPVEPERPKGKWNLVDHLWQCDRCQHRQNKLKPTNFCPDCGAKMEEGEK